MWMCYGNLCSCLAPIFDISPCSKIRKVPLVVCLERRVLFARHLRRSGFAKAAELGTDACCRQWANVKGHPLYVYQRCPGRMYFAIPHSKFSHDAYLRPEKKGFPVNRCEALRALCRTLFSFCSLFECYHKTESGDLENLEPAQGHHGSFGFPFLDGLAGSSIKDRGQDGGGRC